MGIARKFRQAKAKLGDLVLGRTDHPLRKGPVPFVFIHINKTGGTSVAKAIGLPRKRHLTVSEVQEIIGTEAWGQAYTFAFVRNPFDRAVSLYRYRVKTNQTGLGDGHLSFKEWVQKTMGSEQDSRYYDKPKNFQAQVDWLKTSNGKIGLNFIGRFEEIGKDFETIRKAIQIENTLPHLNATTSKKPFQSYYDEETRAIVANWYREDLNYFGYKFSE